MKKFVYLNLACLLFSFVSGCSHSDHNGKNPATPVVSATMMNVLYAGLENPISVAVPGLDSRDLVIEVDSAHEIRCEEKGKCVVIPDANSTTAQVTVKQTGANNENTLLGSIDFRVKRVPDPILKWGPVENGGVISKAVLMSPPPVFAVLENFDFDVKLRITSLKHALIKDGSFISLRSNSNRCTNEMVDVLGKLGASEVVYIEDAVVELPGGLLRTMPAMKVEVY